MQFQLLTHWHDSVSKGCIYTQYVRTMCILNFTFKFQLMPKGVRHLCPPVLLRQMIDTVDSVVCFCSFVGSTCARIIGNFSLRIPHLVYVRMYVCTRLSSKRLERYCLLCTSTLCGSEDKFRVLHTYIHHVCTYVRTYVCVISSEWSVSYYQERYLLVMNGSNHWIYVPGSYFCIEFTTCHFATVLEGLSENTTPLQQHFRANSVQKSPRNHSFVIGRWLPKQLWWQMVASFTIQTKLVSCRSFLLFLCLVRMPHKQLAVSG